MTNRTEYGEQYRVPSRYACEYLARNDGLTLKESTVETYDSILTEFVSFLHQRDITILSAKFDDVQSYIETCVRRGNRQSTISGKLSVVGELYRYLRLETDVADKLELDPIRLRKIDLSQYNTPEKVEREALSREEIRRLFDAFDSYRNRLMAVVGVETGMRNSDIRNLQIDDIREKTIYVRDPKNSKPYEVPISDDLKFELKSWLDNHRTGYSSAEDSKFVFPSQQGKKLRTNASLNEIIKEAAEQAGLQETIGTVQIAERQRKALNTEKRVRELHRVTVHTLRHSYITLLSEAGVELRIRQLVANHSNPRTTLGYDHSSNESEPIRGQYDPPR